MSYNFERMRLSFIFCYCFIIFSCRKDEFNEIDLCPTCTSDLKLNGENWPSKPKLAWYQYDGQNDTFFTLEIREVNPQHDDVEDFLIFWKIPYAQGEFRLDSTVYDQWDTSAQLGVLEHDEGTPTQSYFPLKSGESFVTVTTLDKLTGQFHVELNLILYPDGLVNGQLDNSTYPNMVNFTGSVHGIITEE